MKDWTSWYKNKSGQNWSDSNKDLAKLFDNLSDKDRRTAQLLYNAYVKEKKAFSLAKERLDEYEDKRIDEQKQNRLNAEIVKDANAETLLAKGYIKDNATDKQRAEVEEQVKEADSSTDNTAAYKKAKTAAYTERKVTEIAEKADNKVAAEEKAYEKKEEKAYYDQLEKVKAILEKNSFSGALGVKYYDKGKQKAKEYLEGYKKELGDKYDDIVKYVDSLPVYDEKVDGYTVIYTDYGGEKISNKELEVADAVKYKSKAGWLVIKGETYVVTYNGEEYKLKSGVAQDSKTNAFLSALSDKVGIKKEAGATIYYKGKLYVYSGVSDWREVESRSGKKAENEFAYLLSSLGGKVNEN